MQSIVEEKAMRKGVLNMVQGEEQNQNMEKKQLEGCEEELAKDMIIIQLEEGQEMLIDLVEVLVENNHISSCNAFLCLIQEGAVMLNKERVLDIDCAFLENENVLYVGEKRFILKWKK